MCVFFKVSPVQEEEEDEEKGEGGGGARGGEDGGGGMSTYCTKPTSYYLQDQGFPK